MLYFMFTVLVIGVFALYRNHWTFKTVGIFQDKVYNFRLWTLYNDQEVFEKYKSEDCYAALRSYGEILMRFWIWDILQLAEPEKEELFDKIYYFKEKYNANND